MHLLDIFFPKFCVSCGKLGSYICDGCEKTLQPILLSETICPICERSAIDGKTHPYCRTKYTIDGLISFFHYRGSMKKAIKHIKYQFVSDAAHAVVSHAVDCKNLIGQYPFLKQATIIPIPLHASRYRFRGFNQADIFAGELAGIYHLSYTRDMIQRTKASIPQVEMKNREERLKNMKNIFALKEKMTVPRIILLVDDVFTTGATMKEAGSVLKHNGAEIVWALTIAR